MDNNIPQSTDLNPSQNLPPTVPTKPNSGFNKILLIAGLMVFTLLVGSGSYLLGQNSVKPAIPIIPTITQIVQEVCTLEAKICPDGSSVGRTGPNCEFTPCPTSEMNKISPTVEVVNNNTEWTVYKDELDRFQFKYPSTWKIKKDESLVEIYDPMIDNPNSSREEVYGYINIAKDSKGTVPNISLWFDSKFPTPGPELPRTMPPPSKDKEFINKNRIEFVMSRTWSGLEVNETNYFIGKNNIVAIGIRNMTLGGEGNNKLISLYSQILDSIEYN